MPELVHVHPLSAPLWSMLIALPTVMYRLNALLLADELRARLMSEALGREPRTPADFQWDTLRYATANSETEERPIKNLDQLKRIISAEGGGGEVRNSGGGGARRQQSADDNEKEGANDGEGDEDTEEVK